MVEGLILFISVTSLAIAAFQDARFRLIPDACVLVVLVCGLSLSALGDLQSLALCLAGAGTVLLSCIFLFQFRIIGGGDAKLIPAVCLLFPWYEILTLLVVTAMMGGVLAILTLLFNSIQLRVPSERFSQPTVSENDGIAEFGFNGPGMPYGVAILSGVVITIAIAG